jgi:hypothetical protein
MSVRKARLLFQGHHTNTSTATKCGGLSEVVRLEVVRLTPPLQRGCYNLASLPPPLSAVVKW